jgi:hypothetical protein
MTISFGTKAETLERLAPLLSTARVLPQYRFRYSEWSRQRAAVLAGLRSGGWFDRAVIVRSSACREDAGSASLAGQFVSVADVRGEEAVVSAIERVLSSYRMPGACDQVFIQPLLPCPTLAGVAFGVEPNTEGPYVVVNYDRSKRAWAVTGGVADEDQTFYWFRGAALPISAPLAAVVRLMGELERLLGTAALDVEFAWKEGQLYVFQVRRLATLNGHGAGRAEVAGLLRELSDRVCRLAAERTRSLGSGIAWGVMPDWNPAEMIGIRPRPLAASLYRECITDESWARARRRYGYRDLVGTPLMECLGGQPFIDVRASFTSFVPAALPDCLAAKLVDYYLDGLRARPELHDKVETELVLHGYTFDLPERLRDLAGFSSRERGQLAAALRRLTVRVMDRERGPWAEDRAEMDRFAAWLDAHTWPESVGPADLLAFLRACTDRGAVAFAGLARAGFLATCLLASLVRVGLWAPEDEERFLRGRRTIVSRMREDRLRLPPAAFLARYGHLRPGTYDVLTPRYDEAPERYFLNGPAEAAEEHSPLCLTNGQRQGLADLLAAHELPADPEAFLRFVGEAIEAREYGKFVYSRGVSEWLRQFGTCAARWGFSPEDCSFAVVAALREAAAGADVRTCLARSVAAGREAYRATSGLSLPPLLLSAEDVWSFHHPRSLPNYVTRGVALGPVRGVDSPRSDLAGGVLFLPCADPGYDWVFTTGIAAFVTMFGGANSHMAIRARELNLPAAVGVGEPCYRRLGKARAVRVDCRNKQLVIVP